MNDHNRWLDALNYHQQQGKTLAEAVSMADQWPFPYVNGQQTDQSQALMLDKSLHKPTQFDLSNIEESPL